MRSVSEVAHELAKAHIAEDPQTSEVFFVDGVSDEVRLVEVSSAIGELGPGEVLPFRFQARPDQGIPYASVVVLLSPLEWRAVNDGALELPPGWDKAKLKKVV